MSSLEKIAFIFPGQGDQYVGMGKDFYENFSVARECFEEANDLLGRDLLTTIFKGPEEILTQTANSQAGIYVTSMALLRVINDLFPDLKPSVTSGLSLGEYSALTAAEKISFQDCLPLVQKRGDFMSDAFNKTQGFMAAVLGAKTDLVEEVIASVALPNDLWIANYNSSGQIVISGTEKGLKAAAQALTEKGVKRIIELKVHGAFHSGLMKEAEERLSPFILETPLKESPVDIVMNVSGDLVSDEKQIRDNLIQQVTHSVRWEQGVKKMGEMGLDLFLSIGCGKTLKGLNRRNGIKTQTLTVESVQDLDQLEQALTKI